MAILGNDQPIDAMVDAFYFWHGQFIAQKQDVETDFLSAAFEHASDIMVENEAAFLGIIGQHIGTTELNKMRPESVSSTDLADILNTQSKGLKLSVKTVTAYRSDLAKTMNALFRSCNV
jgi:hypothetical protein